MNKLAAELCGCRLQADQRDGISVADIFDGPSPRALPIGDTLRWETELRTFRGERIPVEIVRQPLGTRLVDTLVYAVRDLRERKEAAAERERTLRDLQDHARRLERSNLELQSFTYIASHDLQEPLRTIEMFANRLLGRAKDLPADMALPLERIQHATQRMRALVTDLLDYARLDDSSRPLKSVDLNEVLDGVVSDLPVRINETGAKIEYCDLPSLRADPVHMRQLFQNLISNAVKFAKPNVSPVIQIAARKMCRQDGQDRLVITVTDNGIGFADEHRDQIFKLFKRLHGRTEDEGTGVGLATCRKIVESHGGSINTRAVPGSGATFTISLPAS